MREGEQVKRRRRELASEPRLAAAQPAPAPQHAAACRGSAVASSYAADSTQEGAEAARPPVLGGSVAATAAGPAVSFAPSEPPAPPPPSAGSQDSHGSSQDAKHSASPGADVVGVEGASKFRVCGWLAGEAEQVLHRSTALGSNGDVGTLDPAAACMPRDRSKPECEQGAAPPGQLASQVDAGGVNANNAAEADAARRRGFEADKGGARRALEEVRSLPTFANGRRSWTVGAMVAALGLLLYFYRASRPKYDLDLIPGPWKQAWPIIGNVLPLLRPDFHRVILQWADQYGGIVRGKFLWHDGVLVTDPAALAAVCGRGEGAADKASNLYSPINFMCTPHGHANLLTSPADDTWRAVRKAVALSFSFGNIKKKFPIIRERTGDLVEWLRRKGPRESVDVDQAALRVTLDVIGLAAFGHDYGCVHLEEVPPSHLLRVLPRAFTEVMRRIANPLRAVLPRKWFKNGPKGQQSFEDFQEHMKQLLREIKARGPPARGDTDIGAQLYRVMEASRLEAEKAAAAKGGKRRVAPAISEERILSEIGILFVEGFETTGHTISWTLFNIATTPGVQELVAAELASLGLLVRPRAEGGRTHTRGLELDDLKRLPYLTACVKEAMRMFPVVSVMGRITDKPTRVGPYMLPAGTPIATPLFAIQNTKHNWVNPEEFRPERWQDVPLESYVVDMRAKEGITAATVPVGKPAATAAAAKASAANITVAAAAAPAGPEDTPASAPAPAPGPAPAAASPAAALPPPTPAPAPAPHGVERRVTGRSLSIVERRVTPPAPVDAMLRSLSARRRKAEAEDEVDEDIGAFSKRSGISFMPFSEGPRSCVGQSLAKLEVMTVLAMLLANFRIELAEEMGGREGVRQRESTHLTLQTRGIRGIRMHLYPRDEE